MLTAASHSSPRSARAAEKARRARPAQVVEEDAPGQVELLPPALQQVLAARRAASRRPRALLLLTPLSSRRSRRLADEAAARAAEEAELPRKRRAKPPGSQLRIGERLVVAVLPSAADVLAGCDAGASESALAFREERVVRRNKRSRNMLAAPGSIPVDFSRLK